MPLWMLGRLRKRRRGLGVVVEACSAGAEEGLEERKGKKRTRVYVLCIASIYIQQQPSKQKNRTKDISAYRRKRSRVFKKTYPPIYQSTNPNL